MNSHSLQLSRKKWAWAVISLAALLPYLSTLRFEFAYDDYHQILYNSQVLPPAPLSAVVTNPTFPGDLYRPLTSASYWLQYRLHGPAAWPFHLLNILLHVLCSVLVFELAAPLLRRNRADGSFAPLLAALLFALHPIHVEPVANIVGRAELLAAAFGIFACIIFGRAGGRRGAALSAMLFALACFSKESALTLLPLIPLYGRLTASANAWKRQVLRSLPLCMAALAYLAVRALVLPQFLVAADPKYYHPENPLLTAPWVDRLIPGLKIFGDYLRALVAPSGLKIDYSQGYWDFWNGVYSFDGFSSIACSLLFALLVWAARKYGWSYFGLWTIAAFSLTLNIIVVIGTIKGDRLAYLPSAGFIPFAVGAAACAAGRLRASRGVVVAGAAIVVFFFGFLTMFRVPVWHNNRSVFSQAVRDNPRSSKAAVALAEHWYYREKNIDLGEYWFRKTLEVDPANVYAARHLIDISLKKRKYGSAEYYCREVLKFVPEDPVVRNMLDVLLKARKRTGGVNEQRTDDEEPQGPAKGLTPVPGAVVDVR